MGRFVVLEHDSPRGRHWDLMLENGQVLATWALAEPPDAGHAIAAQPLPDHRPAYLDYEGPISGNRGHVTRWDRGEYEILAGGFGQEELHATFHGEKLRGAFSVRFGRFETADA